MNRLLNPAKALRTLRKTPAILAAILEGVTQEQARTLRDGDDGWSVLFIACHLHDYEQIYTQRVYAMLEQHNPTFAVTENEELVRLNNYAAQDLRQILAGRQERRHAFIALLEGLTDAQWLLPGLHPAQGPATVLDVAINTGLHDVDHIEQITRCLMN
jgi:hypothetical protein